MSLCAGVCLLSLSTNAQIITDSVIAAAARDSLLRKADNTRQQIARNAGRFITSAPRTATARHVVRGYYYSPNGQASQTSSRSVKAWKHVTKTYPSGATNERYTGYANNGLVVLRERRHNGSITWLNLNLVNPLEGQDAAATGTGSYTREGYVRLGRKLYLAPRLIITGR